MFLQRQKQYKSFTNRRLYHKNAETKGNFFLFPFCIFDISKHSSLARCSSDKLLTFIISHFFSRKVVYVLWQEGIKGYFKTIIRKELDNYKNTLSRLSCQNSRNTMTLFNIISLVIINIQVLYGFHKRFVIEMWSLKHVV